MRTLCLLIGVLLVLFGVASLPWLGWPTVGLVVVLMVLYYASGDHRR